MKSIKIRARKFSLKQVLVIVLGAILLSSIVSVYFVGSNPNPSSRDVYLDDLPSTASYVINNDGSGNYWATRYDGKIPSGMSGTNDDLVIQYALNNCTANGGLVFVRQGTYTASVTVKNNTVLMLEYGVSGVTYTTEATGIVLRYTSVAGEGYAVLDAPLNMTGHQVLFGVFHSGSTLPSSPTEAQWFYRTSDHVLYVWNSTAWVNCFAGDGGSTHDLHQDYSYVVFKEDSMYYMKNGTTEQVDWSSTSASAIINSAIGNTSSAGGGTVFIKAGIYEDVNIKIWSDIRLTGEGNKTILRSATNIADYRGFLENKNIKTGTIDSNFEIDHLYFDGRWADQANYAPNAIYLEGVENVHIHHCSFRNVKANAILIQAIAGQTSGATKGVVINNNYANYCGYNFFLAASTHASYPIEGLVIANNEVIDTDVGIGLQDYTKNVAITDNYCHDNRNADHPAGITGAGICLQGGATYAPAFVSITGNVLAKNRGGINYVTTGGVFDSHVIQGNVIEDCWATTEEGYGTNAGYGLTLGNSINFVVSDNIVKIKDGESFGVGIKISGTRHVVSNNIVYGGSNNVNDYPIQILGTWHMISGNSLINSGILGFTINGADNCSIFDNFITDTTGALLFNGFNCLAGTTYNRFQRNTLYNITRGGSKGFYLVSGANNNYIYENRFESVTTPISDAGTGNIKKRNVGYITENSGSQTVANSENIAHGLVATPVWVSVSSCNATYDDVAVVVSLNYAAFSSTNIQVNVYWANGTAITDDVIMVMWEARTWN